MPDEKQGKSILERLKALALGALLLVGGHELFARPQFTSRISSHAIRSTSPTDDNVNVMS
jgi:hypothetical protein